MKISELSTRSGVPLPTIKFYIREGLLPGGALTAKNQADYTDEHLSRLLLVRALKDDAGLGIATIARALKAADASPELFVTAAVDALERPSNTTVDEQSEEYEEAKAEVVAMALEMGCDVNDVTASVAEAARALAVVHRSFDHVDLKPYAEAASLVARYEIPDDWRPAQARNAALHYAVLGTVMAEPILLAFRRMAHVARARALEARARAAGGTGAERAPRLRDNQVTVVEPPKVPKKSPSSPKVGRPR